MRAARIVPFARFDRQWPRLDADVSDALRKMRHTYA
jgi:hypothetical protein